MESDFKSRKGFMADGKLSFSEFETIYRNLKASEVASTFKQQVTRKENLQTLGGTSEASNEGTTHSVRVEEQLAFSDWINSNLKNDPDLKHLLPIDPEGKLLYEKVKDGILLWCVFMLKFPRFFCCSLTQEMKITIIVIQHLFKTNESKKNTWNVFWKGPFFPPSKVINHSCPDTIDERVINKKNLKLYTKLENLTLALTSAQAIGCSVVNIDAHYLEKGTPHLVLGLLWQIIRIGLFNQITLEHCPGLTALLTDEERIEDLLKLSPEAILLRWVNYQLEKSGTNRRIANFQGDIADSEVYTYLLKQIAPHDSGVHTEALYEKDYHSRAELMLQQAAKLKCRAFVTPQDVVNGVYKLNLAFVANLFNNHPSLEQTNGTLEGFDTVEETREEKSKTKS